MMSIEEFNQRISDFRYGKEEKRYIPGLFKKLRLRDNNMKVTAKEMWQFTYLLPIIVGDKIPHDDEMWEMCKNLIEAIEILLSSAFFPGTLDLLERKISRHNFLYNKNCGNLTPKMHLATHICTSIKAMGPPRHYMCFRLEEKQKFFKIYDHVTNCRRNMLVSFAIKYSLFFANLLLMNTKHNDISVENKHIVSSNYPEFLRPNSKCYKKVCFNGTNIVSGMYIPLNDTLHIITHKKKIL